MFFIRLIATPARRAAHELFLIFNKRLMLVAGDCPQVAARHLKSLAAIAFPAQSAIWSRSERTSHNDRMIRSAFESGPRPGPALFCYPKRPAEPDGHGRDDRNARESAGYRRAAAHHRAGRGCARRRHRGPGVE